MNCINVYEIMKPKSKNFSPSDIQISKVKLREAITLKNRSNIEKSITEFKKILYLFPNYAAAHRYLAEAYIEIGGAHV